GLFEVLAMSDTIRTLVSERAASSAIHRAAVDEGMRTLREDGIRLCLEGVTTVAEVRRVAGTWDAS
ncbi:MAG: type II/IV secretion system protein, partial [Gaiellaceae bacterium]